jgi:hypothetical protein
MTFFGDYLAYLFRLFGRGEIKLLHCSGLEDVLLLLQFLLELIV